VKNNKLHPIINTWKACTLQDALEPEVSSTPSYQRKITQYAYEEESFLHLC